MVTRIKMHADGPEVSRMVSGFWRLDEWGLSDQELLTWLKESLEIGITTFDHADNYGDYTNETRFGSALKLEPSLREKMELVSMCNIMLLSRKFPDRTVKHYNTSYEHIIQSAENSLKNLNTDYLDLMLINRPDPLMNVDEAAAAFAELVKSGKVRAVGVSNFSTTQFELLQSRLDIPLVTNQLECSVMDMFPMHNGVFDQCQMLGIAPMVWSPLAGGVIFRPDTERERMLHNRLMAVGEEMGGLEIDTVAISWLIRHPVRMIPMLGTRNIERLKSAVKGLTTEMTRQQWFRIWEASMGHEVP
jgi:predicted oxidoreductase